MRRTTREGARRLMPYFRRSAGRWDALGAVAKDFLITRVGAEPLVVCDRDPENDLPRFTVMMPGWRFEGPGGWFLELGEGAALRFTVEAVGYVPLVPSDPAPDIEHGLVTVGAPAERGWTLAELRAVALAERQCLRARWWRRFRRWWAADLLHRL